jgi:N-acetylmuramoyl-L-alanine amidase
MPLNTPPAVECLPMDLDKMAPLRAEDIRFVVLHTTGTPRGEDTSAAAVNRYHRETLGWSGIGYTFLVRADGSIEPGRPLTKQGAHVRGLNHCSIGIAVAGHGDLAPWTPEQRPTLLDLVARLVREYNVEPRNVIGHREAYEIPGVPDTGKTCPGVLVSMPRVRKELVDRLHPPPAPFSIELPPYPPPA